MKKVFKKIYDIQHIPTWLFLLLIVVVILRIPNFYEPYSYGDETIYLTLGQGVRKGFTLYRDLHDNKPPLLYLTAAVAGNLFWFKSILLLSSLMGITLFYKFSEKLFPKIKSLPVVSTIIFSILTTLPFFEGNIVNAENFMIFPILGAFYILMFKNNNYRNIFFAGILFSLSSLYKIPAIFDFFAAVFLWLISTKFNRDGIIKLLKNTTVLLIGVASPILITFIYYFIKGAFGEYLIAAYLQNFGYLSSWRPDSRQDPFLVKNAPLLIRGGVLLVVNTLLFALKNRVDKKFLFIASWLSFTIFGITLSERPYPHYLLQSAAPVSILAAIIFTSNSMLQVYAILPLTLFFLIPLYYRFWHYRSINYYTNFISMVSGSISKDVYIDGFGGRTKINYEIAGIVKGLTTPGDNLLVWEDSAQVYALSNRLPPFKYLAGYHINDFYSMDEAVSVMANKPPKVIVVFTSSQTPEVLSNFIENNYFLFKYTPDYLIWKLSVEHPKRLVP